MYSLPTTGKIAASSELKHSILTRKLYSVRHVDVVVFFANVSALQRAFSQIGMQSLSDSYYANFEHFLRQSWSISMKKRDS